VLPLFADELKLNCKHGLIEGKKTHQYLFGHEHQASIKEGMGKGEGLVWSASREADESVLMQEGSLPRFDVVEVLVMEGHGIQRIGGREFDLLGDEGSHHVRGHCLLGHASGPLKSTKALLHCLRRRKDKEG